MDILSKKREGSSRLLPKPSTRDDRFRSPLSIPAISARVSLVIGNIASTGVLAVGSHDGPNGRHLRIGEILLQGKEIVRNMAHLTISRIFHRTPPPIYTDARTGDGGSEASTLLNLFLRRTRWVAMTADGSLGLPHGGTKMVPRVKTMAGFAKEISFLQKEA